MLIRIDEASDRPIYAQIADSVRGDMLAGKVAPGAVLPPAREVATGLGANVHTVLRAYQTLRDEGLVDLKRRRGAVVTSAASHIATLGEDIERLLERAASLGVGAEALASLVALRSPSPRAEEPPVAAPAAFAAHEERTLAERREHPAHD